MLGDDRLDDRKAKASTSESTGMGLVHAVETLEDVVDVLRRNPRTLVGDLDVGLLVGCLEGDFGLGVDREEDVAAVL